MEFVTALIVTTQDMAIIAFTQLMPFNIEYALKFVEKVEGAVIH